MPRVAVGANEQIEVKFQLPENSKGDRVFVELTDGGNFVDDPNRGRIFTLGDDRKISIPIQSDHRPGYFNLLVRQAGHTRTLPLWVGPLPELATGDPDNL